MGKEDNRDCNLAPINDRPVETTRITAVINNPALIIPSIFFITKWSIIFVNNDVKKPAIAVTPKIAGKAILITPC